MTVIITAIVAKTSVEVIETNKEQGTAKVHALTAWADCGWDCPAERIVPMSSLQDIKTIDDGFCECIDDHDYAYYFKPLYGWQRICVNCGKEIPCGEIESDEELIDEIPFA